jgi:hypothetical protein
MKTTLSSANRSRRWAAPLPRVLDPVVGSPLFRSAVRARHKQPVEHRQEYRALGSKLELPACGQLF